MSLKDDLYNFRRRNKLMEKVANEAYFDLNRIQVDNACDICLTPRDPDELMLINTRSGVATICIGVKRCRTIAERR